MYEEFKKEVNECGKLRKRTYIRSNCKHCNSIIEFDKSKRKTHKGYCAKCVNIPREGFLLSDNEVIYECKNVRCRGVKLICEKCGKERIISKKRASQIKYNLCRKCVSHIKKPRFHSIEDFQRHIKDNVIIDEKGCWIWRSDTRVYGYGPVMVNHQKWMAHRLSYSVFIGPIPEDKIVCHKCDVKNCVNPEHLFLGSTQDNSADMVQKNRQAKGNKCGASKLTEQEVREIKQMFKDGKSNVEIARRFPKVGSNNICEIKMGRAWSHIVLD